MSQGEVTYEAAEIPAAGNAAVRFLYNTVPGRILLTLLIRTTVSKLAGSILRSPASRFFIKGFIRRNGINMEEYRDEKYKSFNDFFIREIKEGFRPFPDNVYDLAAPCDGKLTAYPVTTNSVFSIKHSQYSVFDLLEDNELAGEFSDGICLIYRLTPDDYHRYLFIDDGVVLSQKRINGVLHTVQPAAHQKCNVFSQNTREYTVMETCNFGKVIQIEVGALFVGRITNHNKSRTVKRGDEKGMFQFGGSTIVMLFQKDAVAISDSIYENTLKGKETIIKMGSKVGTQC